MMLYRGQLMSVTELEKIADNQRGFISLNTFTSASIDRDVALMFAADQQKIDDPNLRGVLFEIEIDISTAGRARPFADITKHSDKKDENEVLFSIGSMFEIQTVKKLNSGTWSIKLKTIKSRPDGRVAELLAHFRRKVQMEQRDVSEFMWGRFFIEVGEYQTARSFYEHLIDHRPSHFLSDENTDDLSSMHNDLGFIHYQQEDYQKAIKHYSIALAHALARIPIWKLVSTGKHPYKTTLKRVAAGEAVSFPKAPYLQDQELDELATLYNNLAGAYDKIGECEHALTYLKKAVALESSCRNKNFDEKVEIANNIGLVQTHLGQLDSALRHCQMAMEWHSTRRYFDSPHKAIICLNIGNIYEVLNDSQHALEYYELALELVSKLLPPNHPLLLACLKKRNAIQEHIKTEKIKAEAERVKVAAAVAEKVAVAEKNRVAVAVTSSPQRTFIMQWHPPIRTANSVRTRCRNWQ
jgi:tetratricopeptide (TPR) repeat protein